MNMTAADVIQRFQLEPLQGEGGFFRRTYCSEQTVLYCGEQQPIVSAIYYLITPDNFSVFHRLKRDETFHFYAGDAIEFVQIVDDKLITQTFGNDLAAGDIPQVIVKGSVWQALRICRPNLGWALIGTTVSPAFDYSDFMIGSRSTLAAAYPHLSATIGAFTRAEK